MNVRTIYAQNLCRYARQKCPLQQTIQKLNENVVANIWSVSTDDDYSQTFRLLEEQIISFTNK